MKHFKLFSLSLIIIPLSVLFSCRSLPPKTIELSREIMGKPQLNAEQLASYFMIHRPDADKDEILQFAKYYIEESAIENINSDVAFAQMCLETGYLTFGNLVVPEMHNYCGLGAMDAEHPGEWFENEQQGIRAHIQHLQAYATTEDVELNQPLIDPRYSWVHRTKYVTDIYGLAGTWAADKLYGEKLDAILTKMQEAR